MTAPAAPRAVGAPARFFLAAVLALGVAFGFATTASATTRAAAQNAVGASTVTLASFVGVSGDVSPATHLESYDSQAITASATGVAANTADGLLAESGTVNPSSIRFSQNSISSNFGKGGSVSDLATGLEDGTISASDVPPIRLVPRDGTNYTLDNRRLWAFQQAGVDVPYRLATPAETAAEAWKFTTTNGGTSITMRGAG